MKMVISKMKFKAESQVRIGNPSRNSSSEESLHKLVRGNVLTATRYFEHKVKQFINRVMMGKNNHMYLLLLLFISHKT